MQTLGGAAFVDAREFLVQCDCLPLSRWFFASSCLVTKTVDCLWFPARCKSSRWPEATFHHSEFNRLPPPAELWGDIEECRVTWRRSTASWEACWRVMDNYAFIRAVGKGSYGEVNLVKHKTDRKQVRSCVLYAKLVNGTSVVRVLVNARACLPLALRAICWRVLRLDLFVNQICAFKRKKEKLWI